MSMSSTCSEEKTVVVSFDSTESCCTCGDYK